MRQEKSDVFLGSESFENLFNTSIIKGGQSIGNGQMTTFLESMPPQNQSVKLIKLRYRTINFPTEVQIHDDRKLFEYNDLRDLLLDFNSLNDIKFEQDFLIRSQKQKFLFFMYTYDSDNQQPSIKRVNKVIYIPFQIIYDTEDGKEHIEQINSSNTTFNNHYY